MLHSPSGIDLLRDEIAALDARRDQFLEPAHACTPARRQRIERGADRRMKSRTRADLVTRVVLDLLDDPAADHHRVGDRADALRAVGVADAEAHAHRHTDRGADLGNAAATSSTSSLALPVTPLSET